MDYVHVATAFRAAQYFRLRLVTSALAALRRVPHWVRTAGVERPPIDRMTDEVERALAGERPDSPYHRYRYRR